MAIQRPSGMTAETQLHGDRPLLLTVKEASHELGCGRTYLYRLLSSGELPKVSLGRATRIPERSVREFAERLTHDAIRRSEIAADLKATYRRLHDPIRVASGARHVG